MSIGRTNHTAFAAAVKDVAPDPYAEGWAAWLAGKRDTDNPYPAGSTEAGLWRDGHFAAETEIQE